jgi:hypothetical protein
LLVLGTANSNIDAEIYSSGANGDGEVIVNNTGIQITSLSSNTKTLGKLILNDNTSASINNQIDASYSWCDNW